MATINLDGKELATVSIAAKAGFVGIGTSSFIRAVFDDFDITSGKLISESASILVY